MKNKAFTLIEILIVVSVIAVIGAGAIVGATGVRESARQTKLNNDVEALNRAIPIYLTFGGSFSGDEDAEGILRKLKTKRTEDNAATSPGLTSSLIDRRLEIVWQSEDEGSKGGSRAIWNGTRFEVVESGGPGIKEFTIDNQMGGSDAEREVREDFLLAHDRRKGPGWVWDYVDAQPATPEPVQPPLLGVPDPTPTLAPEPTPPEPTDAPVPTQPPTPTEEPTTPPTVEPTTPPTEPPTPTPTIPPVSPSVPGVLISGGNIANNATINGSVVLAMNRDGSVPSLTLNNNSTILGSIFAPGTPNVVVGNNGVVGAIVNLNGPVTPTNYTITVENGARVNTVYRRVTPVPMLPPPVVAPTGLTPRGDVEVKGNKSQTLSGGLYTDLTAGNKATLTLGVAGATTPTVYHFNQLNLGNGVTINVVGPVIVYLDDSTTIQNGVVFGNPAKPEWLQIKVIDPPMGTSTFEVGNNGTVYAQITAPDSNVTFSNNATFKGSVVADYLDLVNNGTGVIFTHSPLEP